MPASHKFIGYPAAVLRDAPNGKAKIQRIWGSFLKLSGNKSGDWLEVKFGKNLFWVHEQDTQDEGTLEIMFLDIGQGDGCLVTTPDNKKMIIDAGANDNLVRFLNHKYRFSQKPVEFESFIITHPDQDHYRGFDPVFDDTDFSVKTVYHSGIVERTGQNSLGKKKLINGRSYLTELIDNKSELDRLLTPGRIGRKRYPKMLRKALDSGRVSDIRMINATHGHLPKYGSGDDITIQVLGPVPENVNGGQPALRWLSNPGKTKNGHSVVLRLAYGQTSFLLGGDLNIPAEDYLLEHYTGERVPPRTVQDEELLVKKARKVFESDFAKSCHHGSADFTEFFLQAVNAHATVISSGDDEPHAHPRADTLGTIGKHSRGRRSLIFSTELARSTRETIKNAKKFREKIKTAAANLEKANLSGEQSSIDKAQSKFDKLLNQIERSVTVFGAINMRTDGEKTIFAYKIERPQKASRQWDIYKFERDSTGELKFLSKH